MVANLAGGAKGAQQLMVCKAKDLQVQPEAKEGVDTSTCRHEVRQAIIGTLEEGSQLKAGEYPELLLG